MWSDRRTGPERLLQAVLGGTTALMVVVSWPLWTGASTVPRVPFLAEAPDLSETPHAWAIALVAGLVAGARWPGLWLVAMVPALMLVLDDQHRAQPWLYQWALTGGALALAPRGVGWRLARAVHLGVYVHSGLSKLDAAFVAEVGADLLFVACPGSRDWPAAGRALATLAMPAGEIVVALGLAFRPTRRLAIVAAVVGHLGLVAVLGPWGLDHSFNVLAWNLGFAAQTALLFGADVPDSGREGTRATLARGLVVVALALPLFERGGLWDAWPSFALYASHCERANIALHVEDAERWPEALRPYVAATGTGPWRRLDLTAWSRAERGTPPYPQPRATLGVALGLARYGRVKFSYEGKAGPFSRGRARWEAQGASELAARATGAWGNAWPRSALAQ